MKNSLLNMVAIAVLAMPASTMAQNAPDNMKHDDAMQQDSMKHDDGMKHDDAMKKDDAATTNKKHKTKESLRPSQN